MKLLQEKTSVFRLGRAEKTRNDARLRATYTVFASITCDPEKLYGVQDCIANSFEGVFGAARKDMLIAFEE